MDDLILGLLMLLVLRVLLDEQLGLGRGLLCRTREDRWQHAGRVLGLAGVLTRERVPPHALVGLVTALVGRKWL